MPNSVFPHSPITAPSAVPAALSWALATLAAGAALGAGWCFLDAIWSPLIVLPALVGASLGLASTAALSFAPTSSRAWAAGVTFAGSALTALVFHYVSYQRARADFDDARERLLTKGGLAGAAVLEQAKLPESFPDYLRYEAETSGRRVAGFGREQQIRGGWVYTLWAAEAAVVFGAAYAIVGPAARRPLCPLCRTWRAPIRSGRVAAATIPWRSEPTGLATTPFTPGVAGPVPHDDRPVEYQIQSCRCGAVTQAIYTWNDGESQRREDVPENERTALLARLDGRSLPRTPNGSDGTA